MTTAERHLFNKENESAFQARLEGEERPKREAAERAYEVHLEEKSRRFEAFLLEYEALCRKHGVHVGSCGSDSGLELIDSPEQVTRHIVDLRTAEDLETHRTWRAEGAGV